MKVDHFVRTSSGRVIGQLNGRTMICKRNASKHMLNALNEPAWALDAETIYQLAEHHQCDLIRFEDDYQRRAWEISLADFLARGQEIDFGHGKQLKVHIRYFASEEPLKEVVY